MWKRSAGIALSSPPVASRFVLARSVAGHRVGNDHGLHREAARRDHGGRRIRRLSPLRALPHFGLRRDRGGQLPPLLRSRDQGGVEHLNIELISSR